MEVQDVQTNTVVGRLLDDGHNKKSNMIVANLAETFIFISVGV